MALTPEQFNKPCLMTYGEIAERLAYMMAGLSEHHGQTGEGLAPFPWSAEHCGNFGHIMSEQLLKLEKVDLR